MASVGGYHVCAVYGRRHDREGRVFSFQVDLQDIGAPRRIQVGRACLRPVVCLAFTLQVGEADGTELDAFDGAQTGTLEVVVDVDNDGDEDLFVANGHVYPETASHPMDSEYEQPPLLFLRWTGFALTIIGGCGLGALHLTDFGLGLTEGAGGILGKVLESLLVEALSPTGATLLLVAIFLATSSLAITAVALAVSLSLSGVAHAASRWLADSTAPGRASKRATASRA